MRYGFIYGAGVIGLAAVLFSSLGFESGPRYEAAVYSGGPAFRGEQRLRLFPLNSPREQSISLPFPLGHFAVGSDGKTLYAQAGLEAPGVRSRPGIFKIEFNPIRVNQIPGSAGFRSSFGLAISAHQDRILISGPYSDGAAVTCGVFELMVKDGSVKRVLPSADCHAAKAWTDLSLSPDGLKAAAMQERQLMLIDLVASSAKSLGRGFRKAAWSPDGKWIAAREAAGEERTVLFETHTFAQNRTLGNSEVVWSPDSRYLLAWKSQTICGPDFFTLEELDVVTGSRTTIQSSRCKVIENESLGGWVSSEIVP